LATTLKSRIPGGGKGHQRDTQTEAITQKIRRLTAMRIPERIFAESLDASTLT